jgi:hypothetical protein
MARLQNIRKQKKKRVLRVKKLRAKKVHIKLPSSSLDLYRDYISPSGDMSGNNLISKMSYMRDMIASHPNMINMGGTTSIGLIPASSGNFYLDSLCDPFRPEVRLPDKYSRPTAVHKSTGYGLFATAANKTLWAVLNPILGDGATLAVRNRWISAGDTTSATPSAYVDDPDRATIAGIVQGCRPVSAGMFISYVGDTLTDGGQIAAAWVPGDIPSATMNALLTGGVAAIAAVPGAYVGPLSRGCYITWRPDDFKDYEFLTTNSALSHTFPTLVIGATSTSASASVLRYSAVTNFEITTTSHIKPILPSPVLPLLVDQACQVMALVPAATANEDHQSWWGNILNGAKNFFETVGQGFASLFAPSIHDIVGAASVLGNNQGLVSVANTAIGARRLLAPAVMAA